MDIKRLILIAGASLCVLVAYTAENIAMDRVARWIEVDQDGYLWWSEEWMQLFEANNFVDRGKGRILLTGSSEVREGFLFDEFESELHGFEVYNNAYSNHTLQTLMVVLQYIESAYGPSAVPDKIVLGVAPLFLLDEPSIDRSYLPKVIDRYSPFFNLDTGSRPVRLVSKGWRDSLEARYRYLTHQSRRFQGTMRGLMRFGVLTVAPGMADSQWIQYGLVPSKYHHLPPIDQRKQLQEVRRDIPSPPDPVVFAATARMEWAMLSAFVADHDIDLYVVNMPQTTLLLDDYYSETYDGYMQLLRNLAGDVPFLDLARFLQDDEFYDTLHPNLLAARRVSKRVAQFVRETDAVRHRASLGRDAGSIVHTQP